MLENKKFVLFVLIFIQVLFGINFSASKIIVDEMDPVLWSNLRFFLAGVGMLLLTLASKRPHPPFKKSFFVPITILSVMGMALGQGLFLMGLKHTTSVNSAIIITMIPILTLLIVVIRKQEEFTFNKMVGFVLSFFGVILMRNISEFELTNSTLIGDILVFAAAACFATYISFGKKYFMLFDGMWTTTWMFFISGLLMGLFTFDKLIATDFTAFDGLFYGSAFYSIIGATLLTYLLNNWALARAPAGNVAIFIYLQPVVAGLIGYFFLGEIITARMLICSGMILAGLLFSLSKN